MTQTAGVVAEIRDETRLNNNGCDAMRDCVLRLLEDFNLLDQLVAKSKSSSNADVDARRQSSDITEGSMDIDGSQEGEEVSQRTSHDRLMASQRENYAVI